MKQSVFDKTLAHTLKFKLIGSRKKYFVTEAILPKASRDAYYEQLIEVDDEAEQVEDVLGDISDTAGLVTDDLNAAKLDNLRMRTAVLQQKLEEQKQVIWSEWNEAVFDEFSEAFSKVKNTLISLHLSEEQLESLNEGIDSALKNLADRLDAMWSKFRNGDSSNSQN